MQIVTDITRCITTIILTLINEPLQSYGGTSSIEHLLNYCRNDDNTEKLLALYGWESFIDIDINIDIGFDLEDRILDRNLD